MYGPYDSAANMKNSVIFPNKIHFPKTSRRLPQVRERNSNKKINSIFTDARAENGFWRLVFFIHKKEHPNTI